MAEPRYPRNAVATATLEAGVGSIAGAVLCAGADTATAIIKTGGSGGTVIAKISAVANTVAVWAPGYEVAFTDLHVTITGTSPQFSAHV